ncbi:MAG: hypothetical protein Q9214_001944, partial [Letrouitia sp. 1 TL-2023]
LFFFPLGNPANVGFHHKFRGSFTLDVFTGEYHTNVPSPTNIPSDVPLAAYGVQQSYELATALAQIDPPIDYVYSSPMYRCLQTIEPAIGKLRNKVKVRAENGFGEFYGLASFEHPSPAPPSFLQTLFPTSFDENYESVVNPPRSGESIPRLHERVAYTLYRVIATLDAECGDKEATMLICTHAATLIAVGRALTGSMPDDVNVEDFLAPTAGITKYVRKETPEHRPGDQQLSDESTLKEAPDWKGRQGISGGWVCELNGDCSHLRGGFEKAW